MSDRTDWSHVRQEAGNLLVKVFQALFLLFFWLEQGIVLGGDPTYFGSFLPHLQVQLPFAGCCVLGLFLGKWLEGSCQKIALRKLFFLSLFLLLAGGSVCASFVPESSVFSLLLWGIAFLASGFGDLFSGGKSFPHSFFLVGTVLGLFTWDTFGASLVNRELLGVASVLGMVFIARRPPSLVTPMYLLVYSWILFQIGSWWLIMLVMGLCLAPRLWTSRRLRAKDRSLLLPFLFLGVLIVWGLPRGSFYGFQESALLPGFFHSWTMSLLGVGEGQFAIAFAKLSPVLFHPHQMLLPANGFLLVLFEKGILGLLAMTGFIFVPFLFEEKRPLLLSFLFGWSLVFLRDVWLSENMIFFMSTFLLAQQE